MCLKFTCFETQFFEFFQTMSDGDTSYTKVVVLDKI